jgi:type II secretory ATPase GspE/PulE/Tfp pilus assembly ATPase PilB-like protein
VRVPGERVGLDGGEAEIFEAVGCPRCRQTGHRGRVGLYEVMTVTDEMRTMIAARTTAHEVGALAVAQGMRRLYDDGLAKVRAGEITLAELTRVLG